MRNSTIFKVETKNMRRNYSKEYNKVDYPKVKLEICNKKKSHRKQNNKKMRNIILGDIF